MTLTPSIHQFPHKNVSVLLIRVHTAGYKIKVTLMTMTVTFGDETGSWSENENENEQ